ncbi:MAG: hypothetical protein OXE40_05520, partial [Gammaproteobacteria bacterium]|nr:hypothetical protein [Gammaproteobacteria bacterium]
MAGTSTLGSPGWAKRRISAWSASQDAALISGVRERHRVYLVEEQLLRHAPETLEGTPQTNEEHLLGLALKEARPRQARVARYHQKDVAPSPGEAEAAEVHIL